MSHIDTATWTQLILGFAGALGGLGAWLRASANGRQAAARSAETNSKIDATITKVDANTVITQQTQKATDGMKDQLVEAVKVVAFHAGQKDQLDKQADIQSAVDVARNEK